MKKEKYTIARSPDAYRLALKQCKEPFDSAVITGLYSVAGEGCIATVLEWEEDCAPRVDALLKRLTSAGVHWMKRRSLTGHTFLVLDGIGRR